MDNATKSKIKRMVLDVRAKLEREMSEVLEGVYGLRPDGSFEEIDNLPDIKNDQKAIKAREGFKYYIDNEIAAGKTEEDAIKRIIIELTFSHLNRLIALKLMERRNVIRESVSRLTNSNGFLFYIVDVLKLQDIRQVEDIDSAYQDFIDYQYTQASKEVKYLFDQDNIASYVPLRPRKLKEVLSIINSPEIDEIWEYDETLGWVYQFFIPKELRDQLRAESTQPRDALELAYRNQFYTPRYTVQYLTDNTLGRLWYESKQGKTKLISMCEYMVRPPKEVFLGKNEKIPVEIEDFVVPFREKKDPRKIKVLDPACGSGHFLLYVFDLLVSIYKEAYEDEIIGSSLKQDYPDYQQFIRDIPRLILENNIYGIDIDLRAVQITSFTLWLRAHKEWLNQNTSKGERPHINDMNLACAAPMPGNNKIFDAFVEKLNPPFLKKMVIDVWNKMQLAGEAGSLLQIDEELKETIQRAKEGWLKQPKDLQLSLYPSEPEPEQQTIFDFRNIEDEAFFSQAAEKVYQSLNQFAESVEANNSQFSRRLFADESKGGLDFITILQSRFDVILMNPPFGDSTPSTKDLFSRLYPDWNKNLLCAFIHRMLDLTEQDGFVGVIFDRTALVKSTYENFRRNIIIGRNVLFTMADTGWDVLDANVETTTMVFSKNLSKTKRHDAFFFDIRDVLLKEKQTVLLDIISKYNKQFQVNRFQKVDPTNFLRLPNSVIGYNWEKVSLDIFVKFPPITVNMAQAYQGHTVKADVHIRNFWEVEKEKIQIDYWSLFYRGGDYSLFYMQTNLVVLWKYDGKHLFKHPSTRICSYDLHRNICLGFGKRGYYLDVHLNRGNHIFSHEGSLIRLKKNMDIYFLLGILNSKLISHLLNLFSGQHKQVGYINLLPIPDKYPILIHNKIEEQVKKGYHLKYNWYFGDELNYQFDKPWVINWKTKKQVYILDVRIDALIEFENIANQKLIDISRMIDKYVYDLYEIEDPDDIASIEAATIRRSEDVLWKETRSYSENQKKQCHVEASLSWWLGCLFGRWDYVNGSLYDEGFFSGGQIYDLRPAIEIKENELWEKDEIISEPTKFVLTDEEIKTCQLVDYPILTNKDGIIPLDENHPEDLVKKIKEMVSLTFGEDQASETIDQIESILGQDLRTYFHKKFFETHAARYQKRPIYWLLQSPRRLYSLYLYYHKIDSDTLFKVISKYINPNINLLESEVKSISSLIKSESGTKKTELEKQKERLEEMLLDLSNFKVKVEEINRMGYLPDMDDGIAVNIAPFHEVIPWAEAKKYWEKLETGSFDWSKMALKLWPARVKDKCRKDKGLAVVHGFSDTERS